MAPDIFFSKDVFDRLNALRQSNERWLRLAETLGADPRILAIVRAAIMGTLDDVAVSFGLRRPDTLSIPQLPVESRYVFSAEVDAE